MGMEKAFKKARENWAAAKAEYERRLTKTQFHSLPDAEYSGPGLLGKPYMPRTREAWELHRQLLESEGALTPAALEEIEYGLQRISTAARSDAGDLHTYTGDQAILQSTANSKIIVDWDDDDRGTQTGTWTEPVPGFKPTPIREQLDTPIDPESDCCVVNGKPCILYPMLDYGKDWSGEFVREVHPFVLAGEPTVSAEEFWKLVRALQKQYM